MIGKNLGHYRVLTKIGEGGMGEVYLAEDTKLDRKVALKVLPPELAESEERRARFEREAKALAALDHPNIITVHSVERADGLHFITMQLVRGKTLTELLPKHGFPLSKFFDISIPLADAVAAAHQEGITHRDLKPDNVMVSDDRRVKVLDFGLAKLTGGLVGGGAASALPTAAKTTEGVIVGTLNYMSPEQTQGKPVDARSDIFSLGILIYQMLTGRRPFDGVTPAEVLSSIIKDDPPPVSETRSEIPDELSRIVRRCLAKDPSRRTQTALDVRNELEELRGLVPSGDAVGALGSAQVEARRRSRRLWLVGAGIALLVVVASTSGVFRFSMDEPVVVPRLANPLQVTSATRLEDAATWSPDGRSLAYHSDQSGNTDIWISQVDGGQPLNRTSDHAGTDQYPSWSPDGTQIAFESGRGGGGIFVMSVFAGPAQRVSRQGVLARGRPQWSSTGSELAYEVREGDQSFAEITSIATGESTRVELPSERLRRLDLSWSPSGRYFAYIEADNPNNNATRLMILRVEDGSSFAITAVQTRERTPSWSGDERAVYFTSNRGGTLDLWMQRLGEGAGTEGDAQPVTVGLEMQSAALSPDGTRLAYSKGRNVANIWRVPIRADRLATWADAEQLTFDHAAVTAVDVSPDGTRLAFGSDRQGSDDLWILSLANRELRQITSDPGLESGPSWSPGGRELTFYSNRAGTRDVWVTNVDGGPARPLTQHDSEDFWPAWHPDGSSIVFASTRSGDLTIWSVSTDGGPPTQLVEQHDINRPHWSPDGEWLLFSSFGRHIQPRVWLMHRSETEPTVLTDGLEPPIWLPDGQQVLFKRARGEGPDESLMGVDVWTIDLETRAESRLSDFSERAGRLSALATDGAYLYFKWREELGDIWVMDVVTDEE